jgi:hypothetical protein
MDGPELSLTIERDPQAKLTTLDATKEMDAGVAADIKAKRALLHARAAQEDRPAVEVPTVDTATQPREDVESIEFILPDGRLVVFGPPSGISLTMRILNMGGNPSPLKSTLYRVLMCVREIDGVRPELVVDDITAQKLSNMLGDNNIDILSGLYSEYWPGVRKSDLPLVKKNLRQ